MSMAPILIPTPQQAFAILRNYRTCEFSTMSKDGTPITWPVCARLLHDGRFLLTTSIGMPQKAFNIRRNPKVSLLFSEPMGSGVEEPGAVLVQGTATAEDRIVTDVNSVPELREYIIENIFGRQPNGKFMSSWFGKLLIPMYYMRILIYVKPERMFHWLTRDFVAAPTPIEVPRVA